MTNNVIDIKEILAQKKDKNYLEKGGTLLMTIKDEDGNIQKYRVKLKNNNQKDLKG